MKTKELLNYLNTDNLIYLCKLKEYKITELIFKQVLRDYEGSILCGVLEVNNKEYYYTHIDFDRGENQVFVILDTNDYDSIGDWEELLNRDLDIIGYFKYYVPN